MVWPKSSTLLASVALGVGWGIFYAAPSARADIVIGLLAPITGDNAPSGEQLQNGAEAAIARINSQGGVLGEKLVVSVHDDACSARTAISTATKVVGENIGFVVGPWCSSVDLLSSSIFAAAGTIQISLASNELITAQGFDGLFRINGRSDRQGFLLADFITAHHAGQNIALVAESSAFGTATMDSLRTALKKKHSVTIAVDQTIGAGAKDFTSIVSSFNAAGVQAVAFVGFPPEGGLLVRQTVAAGMKVDFMSVNTMSNRQLWDIAGKSAAGLVFSCATEVEKLPEAQDAVNALKAEGKSAGGYTLYSYAGVELLAEALIRAKSTSPDAVADELQKGNFPTVMGNVSFDEKGDITQPIWRICRWSEGKYDYFED
jgi:branched-chain amino acid transport system substrate-binding protein